jgi:PBSX family phage terminase large subunit
MLKQEVNKKYNRLFKTDKRYILLCGGRSAGRSFVSSQFILANLVGNKYSRIAMMRFILGDIKNSIFQEVKDRVEEKGVDSSVRIIENPSLGFSYGRNLVKGIGFRKSSSDQKSKLKSLASFNYVVIEEADEIDEESFIQLDDSLRTIKSDIKVIMLFNMPDKNHWIIRRWFNLVDCGVEGFYKAELKESEKHNTEFIFTTFRDNQKNLNKTTIENFFRYKETRPDHYWNMIEGLVPSGKRGVIYKTWQPMTVKEYEDLPYNVFYGLDFGFSCLTGETLIKTDCGNKRLDKIKTGDMVLTSNGFKKVIWAGSKGFRQVYDIDFGYGKSIIGTSDHKIYTENGWKEAKSLNIKENICVLKPSLITEFIQDIQMVNTLITFTIKQKKRIEYYIGIFMNTTLVKSLVGMLSIILTAILSITALKISKLCQFLNTLKHITVKNLVQFHENLCQPLGKNMDIQKKIGQTEERSLLKQLKKELLSVLSVIKKLHQPMFIKNIVGILVEKKQILKKVSKNIFAKIVEKLLLPLHIMKEKPVLLGVRPRLQLIKEPREVFDLMVEGDHEFFANGVLVHNCDAATLIEIKMHNDNIYLRRIVYEVGLLNKSLSDKMKQLGISTSKEIIADSAEPKSIAEMKSYGWHILPADKGADSVRSGVNLLLGKNVYYTEDSTEIATEIQNYTWALDKNKEPTNEPIDDWNHCIDAIRYAVTYQLSKKQPNIRSL